MRALALVALAALACGTRFEPAPSPAEQEWIWSHTLDFREGNIPSCVSIESMSETVAFECGDGKLVSRCDDIILGGFDIEVWTWPEVTPEESFWSIRLKNCEAP